MDERPIGFFDSGFGGVSVLNEAVKILPGENFLYYGDHANMPYGDKSLEEARALSIAAAERIVARGVKALVVACNTATSAAIGDIRAAFGIPILSMEPAVGPACKTTKGGVLVLATVGTLRQPRYKALVAREDPGGRVVSVPCPGLADKIEWFAEAPERFEQLGEEALGAYLAPFHGMNVGAIVLGCTHYVFLKKQLQAYAAKHFPGARLFDGNEGTARQLKRVLRENGLEAIREKGAVTFDSSGDVGVLKKRFDLLMRL